MSMIEQMARAIASHIGAAFDQMPRDKQHFMELSRQGKSGVFDINGPFQDDCLNAAKAALSALSNPTEGMRRALIELPPPGAGQEYLGTAYWGAMIKAAEEGA